MYAAPGMANGTVFSLLTSLLISTRHGIYTPADGLLKSYSRTARPTSASGSARAPVSHSRLQPPCAAFSTTYFPMQCVEHLAAQRIAILRVQKPEIAPFLPSENRFLRPSRAYVFVPAKIAVLIKMCKRPIQGHYRFV